MFLIGMLSKAKGQVLRVAAAIHVLSCDTVDAVGNITVSIVPSTISVNAIVAAQNFVDTCCQHAAYIAGHGTVEEEISHLTAAGTLCVQRFHHDVAPSSFSRSCNSWAINYISCSLLPAATRKAITS